MHYFIWRQEFWGFSFRKCFKTIQFYPKGGLTKCFKCLNVFKCFKTIQFYPKGGLTIQLWRTGRFVELDPTLRQSDGLAVELN